MAHLDTVVDEVISLGIAQFAKTLQFSPRLYIEGMWMWYRQWVQDQIGTDMDVDEISDDPSNDEPDEEYGWIGERRLAEARLARLSNEKALIEHAESVWNVKIRQQFNKHIANHVALVTLFRSMPKLENIEIRSWGMKPEEYGIQMKCDKDVRGQFVATQVAWTHLQGLALAIHGAKSKSKIKRLVLPKIDAACWTWTPSLEYIFSSLTSLSVDIPSSRDFLDPVYTHGCVLSSLIRCAAPTLTKIELRKSQVSYLDYRGLGIEKLLRGDFPSLCTLELQFLKVEVPSLNAFLSKQPVLKTIHFEDIDIVDEEFQWDDVLVSLPRSCTSLYFNNCRHPDSSTTSTHSDLLALRPFLHCCKLSTGWEKNETWFEKQVHDDLKGRGTMVPDAPWEGNAEVWIREWHHSSTRAALE